MNRYGMSLIGDDRAIERFMDELNSNHPHTTLTDERDGKGHLMVVAFDDPVSEAEIDQEFAHRRDVLVADVWPHNRPEVCA